MMLEEKWWLCVYCWAWS